MVNLFLVIALQISFTEVNLIRIIYTLTFIVIPQGRGELQSPLKGDKVFF